MSRLPVRSLIAVMLLLGACAEEAEPRTTDDEDVTADNGSDESDDGDDEENEGNDEDEDDDAMNADAGGRRPDASSPTGPRNDAGRTDGGGSRPDATRPVADAGTPTAPADAGPVATGDDVPAGEHCAPVAAWDAQSAQFEQDVLKLTNEARAAGHNCDTKGMFGPTTPLTMQPQLRCAARLHSKYMAETGKFDHFVPAGSDPGKRIAATGYPGGVTGENIAAGQPTPKSVVDGWLDSDGHCQNIMRPGYTEIGVAYMLGKPLGGRGGDSPYWTQNFGAASKTR